MSEIHTPPSVLAKACEHPGCMKPLRKYEKLCSMHWARRRHGRDMDAPARIVGDDVARFWSKVRQGDPDECWEWKNSTDEFGYGKFLWKGRMTAAHRVSYTLTNGDIDRGLYVLHRCDNPPCVNPAHLFVGTAHDNTRDMVSKGRARGGHVPGSLHGAATLIEADVLAIRAYCTGIRGQQREMARKYGVTEHVISRIVNRRTWRHI